MDPHRGGIRGCRPMSTREFDSSCSLQRALDVAASLPPTVAAAASPASTTLRRQRAEASVENGVPLVDRTQRTFVESFVWQLARMKSRSCLCSLSRRLSYDRVTQIDLAEIDCTKPQSIFSSLHGGVTRATDMMLVGKRASVYGYGASAPVVVVLACYLLNVTPSAPFRRAGRCPGRDHRYVSFALVSTMRS